MSFFFAVMQLTILFYFNGFLKKYNKNFIFNINFFIIPFFS